MRDLLPTLRMLFDPVRQGLWWLFRRTVVALGITTGILMVLACTRVPFDVHHWLGSAAGTCSASPEVIVVLGGSGMPSGPELLRLHQAAECVREWPAAQVVVVHPGDPEVISAMAEELVLRGVDEARITLVNEGDNTRAQAIAFELVMGERRPPITLVTAPENMYRSVNAFEEVGFDRVCGNSAWEHAMDHNFRYRHKAIGGKGWVPDVSDETGLRYTFWNYLKLEVTCLREFVAIGYYKVNGWI